MSSIAYDELPTLQSASTIHNHSHGRFGLPLRCQQLLTKDYLAGEPNTFRQKVTEYQRHEKGLESSIR